MLGVRRVDGVDGVDVDVLLRSSVHRSVAWLGLGGLRRAWHSDYILLVYAGTARVGCT